MPYYGRRRNEIFIEDVPYRFDGKESYLEFLQNAAAAAESTTISFHQPSYRGFSETAAVINSSIIGWRA